MNDDEVFAAVKMTLSDVQMDRPVEAIEQRGRARKRNRGVFAAVAGGALVATAALALTLPGGSHQAATTTAQGGTVAAPVMQDAAYSVVKLPNGSTEMTLNYKQILNPSALEKALAAAGVPAVVKSGELCTPKDGQLPEAKEVFSLKDASNGDGSSRIDLIIDAKKMPTGSEVYFSVFPIEKGGHLAKDAVSLVNKGAAMSCRTIG